MYIFVIIHALLMFQSLVYGADTSSVQKSVADLKRKINTIINNIEEVSKVKGIKIYKTHYEIFS